jgi:predicted MFS family arabinose efflux permease
VLLFSIVSGAVADRLPKRRLLIATQTTLACQGLLLALLVTTGHVEYWHVALLGLALGFANVVDQPARQSFLIEMVGRNDVSSAVALNSAGFNLARIIGPAIAGVVIGRLGVAPTFLVNGLGFTGVIVTLLRMKTPDPPPGTARASIFEEIAEGVRYAAGTPRLRLAIGLVLVVSLCVFNFSVYVPLLAKNVLGLGAEGFGFLMASLGVGAVGGALTVGARAARFPSVRSMLVAATLALGMLVGLGFTRRIELAVPLLFLTGYWGIMLMASCNTSIQLQAPDALRGRVMSIYTWVSGGVFPIGAFIVGSISEAWGVSTAFLFNGTLGLAAVGALGLWWRWRRG